MSLVYAAFYCTTSIAMVATNKLVVSNFDFSFTSFLLLLQAFTTILLAHTLPITPAFSLQALRKLLPLSCSYLLNVTTGLLAVRLLTIPAYTSIKRLTPIYVLVLDFLLRGKRQSATVIVAVFLLLAGPLMVARGDMDFKFSSYAVGFAASGTQALYLISVSHFNDVGFSEIELNYFNSLLTIPPLLLGTLVFDRGLVQHAAWQKPWFLSSLALFSLLSAVFLFAATVLTSRCSGLTLSVMGQLKGLVQTWIGFLWFGKVNFVQEGFVGIGVSTAGAALYAYAKYNAKHGK
eukprot:752568-Hanusia_phi.AAC.3